MSFSKKGRSTHFFIGPRIRLKIYSGLDPEWRVVVPSHRLLGGRGTRPLVKAFFFLLFLGEATPTEMATLSSRRWVHPTD